MAEDNYDDLYNSDVVDRDGKKIGGVGQVYLDDKTGHPTWVTVKTGLFGTKENFVPLAHADIGGGRIRVPYPEATVKDAPTIDPDRHLDADEEADLYKYYGIATQLPGSDGDATPAKDPGTPGQQA
ncbi:MAG: PRC-barrel domain-containing protein [Propionibacterium sp.]